MKNFKYRSKEGDENGMLYERKRKINRQQIIFDILFGILCLSIVAYIVQKKRYLVLDGYVNVNTQTIRPIDDIFIVKMNVAVGDFVKAGDTLFNYIYINQVFNTVDANELTSVDQEINSQRSQVALLNKELQTLDLAAQELSQLLTQEDTRISLGLSTQSKRQELERQYEEILREKALKRAQKGVYESHLTELLSRGLNLNDMPTTYTRDDLLRSMTRYGHSFRSFVAPNNACVTAIDVIPGNLVFKKDEIMNIQPTDPREIDLHISVYLLPADIPSLSEGDEVEVLIAHNYKVKGRVALLGTSVSTLPAHLLNRFDKNVEALDVRIEIMNDDQLPFWVKTDNLPVKVRKARLQDNKFLKKLGLE